MTTHEQTKESKQAREALLECVARAICVASGGNPDTPLALGGVRWHSFLEDEATAAVKAVERFIGHSLSQQQSERPQDEGQDGGGWTFETLEHGGSEKDLMPQVIRATDSDGRSAVYCHIAAPKPANQQKE